MSRPNLIVLLLVLSLSACSLLSTSEVVIVTATPTQTPTLPPTATPTPTLTPTPTVTPIPIFTLSGVIFFDYNGNGLQDEGEPPIEGVEISLQKRHRNADEEKIEVSVATNGTGEYLFEDLPAGDYLIDVTSPNENDPTQAFRYLSLSPGEFQAIEKPLQITIEGDTQCDLGLMNGFLTLPFKCETAINFIIHVDVDPGPAFRDWRGSDGSDYVKERAGFNGHLGTDFAVSGNPPVVAAAPGIVIEAEGGWPNNPKAQDPNTGLRDDGNRVVIDHGGGLLTIYCHLDSISAVVGQTVARGETIGFSGRTGVFAPGQPGHLHFQSGGFGQNRIDPYRDLLDPNSQNWWTKDNDPQCLP